MIIEKGEKYVLLEERKTRGGVTFRAGTSVACLSKGPDHIFEDSGGYQIMLLQETAERVMAPWTEVQESRGGWEEFIRSIR